MSPTPRLDEVPDGLIGDRTTLRELVSGTGLHKGRWGVLPWAKAFWREHEPSLIPERRPIDFSTLMDPNDEQSAAGAMVRAWREQQQRRLDFLIENGYLTGDALRSALSRRNG